MVNYAVLYGKTAFTLAKDINVPTQAAQEFIDAYFAGFPKVRGFIERTLAEARVSGFVQTLYGRRRLVPELNSRNGQMRAAAERAATNHPIQGTAADIMKRAMIDVDQRHRADEGRADDPHRPRRAAVRGAERARRGSRGRRAEPRCRTRRRSTCR